MPTTTAAKPKRPPRALTQADLDEAMERGRALGKSEQRDHDAKGEQHTSRTALELVSRAQQRGGLTDTPVWMKITASAAAIVLSGGAVIGIVWNFAISPLTLRLGMLETARVEQMAATTAITARIANIDTSINARLVSVDMKLAELSSTFATATRIRDQQAQANADRMRVLEQSDQSGTEKLSQLTATIAGILPRLEEILRRQERLENRLGNALPRPGSDDGPASWVPHPRGT